MSAIHLGPAIFEARGHIPTRRVIEVRLGDCVVWSQSADILDLQQALDEAARRVAILTLRLSGLKQ